MTRYLKNLSSRKFLCQLVNYAKYFETMVLLADPSYCFRLILAFGADLVIFYSGV